MKEKFKTFRCAACGDTVQLFTGPGRFAEYRRGVDLAVPDDFAIPTCVGCGERYLSVERGEALQAAQAPLFAAWQRAHCGPLIESIKREHGVTLRDIERACGVSGTYLSHVLAGSKDASLTLIRLLEAFANAPSEFSRQLRGEPWNTAAVVARVESPTYAERSRSQATPGASPRASLVLVGAPSATPYVTHDPPLPTESPDAA